MIVRTQNQQKTIAVLGAGAWGMALAHVAQCAGHRTHLWARDLSRHHEAHGQYLNDAISRTDRLSDALDDVTAIVIAVPAQANRSVLQQLADFHVQAPIVLAAKGIEQDSGLLLPALAQALLPDVPIAMLSGPGFSADVLAAKPTAVTIAADHIAQAKALCDLFSSAQFRCYASSDLKGVAAGGALKNVYAIAAGAADAAGLGASANAALITRAFAELKKLGVALGGASETFHGLSGFGDLVLTCGSARSRNFRFGAALTQSSRDNTSLAEGALSAAISSRLAKDHAVDAPIIDAVVALIAGELTIEQAVYDLMTRPLKTEHGQ